MSPPFKLFLFLFILVFTERLFFYIWLWQLKNYHFKRFIDHFRTSKGRKLIYNPQNLFLVFLILFLGFVSLIKDEYLSFYWYIAWLMLVILFFLVLSVRVLFNLVRTRLKVPIFTKKTFLLIFSGLLFELIILLLFYSLGEASIPILLVIYFLSPVILSLIVLVLQPLTVIQRKKIQKRALLKREKFKDLIVIGITGSYGKTSTKEYLAHILSSKFKVLKTEKHINAEIGIAQTIINDLKDQEVFVCEVGAYEKGKIKEVSAMIKPTIGVLCGINEQHMATFGNQKKITEAKFEITGDVLFVNRDSRFIREINRKNVLCSLNDLKDIEVTENEVSFSYKDVPFIVRAKGKQNIMNILLSIKVAESLGMSLEEIKASLRGFELKEGIKVKKGKTTVIDSTYSSNSDGVLADLDYLSLFEGKKVLIMPCLIELGKSSKEVHERIGKKIGKVCDFAIITTKERFKDIEKGAISSGMKKYDIIYLKKGIKDLIKEGDVVLLESRVPKDLMEGV